MIELKSAVPDLLLKLQYEESRKRNIPYISKLKNSARKRPERAVLCAAGHSLNTHFYACDFNKADVFSLKACDVLKKMDIEPRFAVHVDAKPTEAKYVTRNPNVTYLVGSQCHSDTFDAVASLPKVYEFSARLSSTWQPSEKVISHGTNVAAHAMFIAKYLGYKKIDVIGWDCSYAPNQSKTHVNKNSDEPRIQINTDGRTFMTTRTMLGMAQEATRLLAHMSHSIEINVVGDGLLQFMLELAIRGEFNKSDKEYVLDGTAALESDNVFDIS